MSLIVQCDRCGKNTRILKESERKNHKFHLSIFKTPTKYKMAYIDLCRDCQKDFDHYMRKAESYFMNNKDNAIDIFEKSKYYKD